jgi:Transposase, Mutator family
VAWTTLTTAPDAAQLGSCPKSSAKRKGRGVSCKFKSPNNEELKRRTHVVRIFPNAASRLRLVRALAVETHENWIEATPYLNMDLLREHKKQLLREVT